MPGFVATLNESDQKLSAELLRKLIELEWNDQTITQFEQLLFIKNRKTA